MFYKKIISVVIILFLILHPISLYAEDTATSEAQLEISPTISEIQTTDSDSIDASEASASATIEDQPLNTADESAISSSESAQLSQSTENSNNADINNTIHSESSTGENQTENNIISEIDTGDASASADVINVTNTNVVGSDIHQDVDNITEDHTGDINLTDKPPCSDTSEAGQNDFKNQNTADNSQITNDYKKTLYETIYNSNKAKIINNISLIAVTGDNNSNDIINSINTGDANVQLNIFNMANTNLIGNCGYFGVVNIYGNQTGDIILPYELGYLGAESSEPISQNNLINSGDSFYTTNSTSKNSEESIINQNNAAVQTSVETNANTGGNSASGVSQIQTGTALSNIRMADTTNTNIIGDRWALVLVNYYGDWNGGIENWSGNTETGPHSVLLWVRLPSQNSPQTYSQNEIQNTGDSNFAESSTGTNSKQSVENANDATVQNNIKLVADTGNNSAEGRLSTIKTGNASVTLNEATVANTNIIGKNWFFSIINIFGNFIGNIVFPRPDLAIRTSAEKSEAAPGDEVTYTIFFSNVGSYKAENTKITNTFPSNATLLSYSVGGAVSGNTINWNIGTLNAGQSGSVMVRIKVAEKEGSVTNSASISTSTDEPKKENNSDSVTTQIKRIGGSLVSSVSQSDIIIITPTAVYQPSISYYQQIKPVTKVDVASLFDKSDNHSENKQTNVLGAYEGPQKGTDFWDVMLVLLSAIGILIVPLLYLFTKQINFYVMKRSLFKNF